MHDSISLSLKWNEIANIWKNDVGGARWPRFLSSASTDTFSKSDHGVYRSEYVSNMHRDRQEANGVFDVYRHQYLEGGIVCLYVRFRWK